MPVPNEEHDLAESIRRLVTCLRTSFPCASQMTIASRAEIVADPDVDLSTDGWTRTDPAGLVRHAPGPNPS